MHLQRRQGDLFGRLLHSAVFFRLARRVLRPVDAVQRESRLRLSSWTLSTTDWCDPRPDKRSLRSRRGRYPILVRRRSSLLSSKRPSSGSPPLRGRSVYPAEVSVEMAFAFLAVSDFLESTRNFCYLGKDKFQMRPRGRLPYQSEKMQRTLRKRERSVRSITEAYMLYSTEPAGGVNLQTGHVLRIPTWRARWPAPLLPSCSHHRPVLIS